MKKGLFVIVVQLFFSISFCQEVDFKKNIVLIDGKECLKMANEDNVSISITDMEGNDVLFLRFIHNSKYAKLYNKIIFVAEKRSFTSESYIYTRKMLVKKLVKAKVIEDCKINVENMETFIMKYDEKVEEK